MTDSPRNQSIPETQQACQIIAFNQPPELRTIPTPSPNSLKPHDLLIRIAASSLCHTDLAYLKGNFDLPLPVTLSHETTGTVLATGSSKSPFKPGDRILAGQTFGRCGECEDCRGPEEYRHYCEFKESLMTMGGRNGAFQKYLIVDGREAVLLPEKMSFSTAAPLACAGMTAYRGVKQTCLQAGQWLAIIGAGGGLGHLGVQFASMVWGLKVVAVDTRDEGLELCREVGADAVVDARGGKEKVVEEVRRVTGGRGVDATVEFSGFAGAAEMGAAVTRRHGRFVQVALTERVSIPFQEFIYRDIRFSGFFMASPKEVEATLNAVVEHGVHVENNVFDDLEKIPTVVQILQNKRYRGKATFVLDESAVGVRPGDGWI